MFAKKYNWDEFDESLVSKNVFDEGIFDEEILLLCWN